ncbi:MAG: hypothetical protein ACK4PR_11680 [Gammaproteobacteria bacterium]
MLIAITIITSPFIVGGAIMFLFKYAKGFFHSEEDKIEVLKKQLEELKRKTAEEIALGEQLNQELGAERGKIIQAHEEFDKLIGKSNSETTDDKIVVVDNKTFDEVALEVNLAGVDLLNEQEIYLNQYAKERAKKRSPTLVRSISQGSFFTERESSAMQGLNNEKTQKTIKQL